MIRVLCFGDSLTAGYFCMGRQFHPYGKHLCNLLSEETDETCSFDHIGLSGFTTTQMVSMSLEGDEKVADVCGVQWETLETLVKSKQLQGDPSSSCIYDYAIVLAGTNDLAFASSPEAIFKNLKAIYGKIRDVCPHITIVGCSIPEMQAETVHLMGEHISKVRKSCNDLIKESLNSGPNTPDLFSDISACIPFSGWADTSARDKLWDDGLHFTPAGYDRIAECIFQTLHDARIQ